MATDQQIRGAIATAERVLAGAQAFPYPRELFPELARRDRHSQRPATFAAAPERPVAQHPQPITSAAEKNLTPEQVSAWAHELGFDRVTARAGRITRAND